MPNQGDFGLKIKKMFESFLVLFYGRPLPSEIPSPALGAGPGLSGVSGWMNWLPLGTPSPEFGAGPDATAAALAAVLTERTVKAKIATIAKALIIFFMYTSSAIIFS